MEKVKSFFGNLSEKNSYQIVFFVISMCIVLGLYVGAGRVIAHEKAYSFHVTEDKNLIKYVENVSFDGDEIVISGWGLYKDTDSNNQTIQICLNNIDYKEEVVWLEVERKERADINKYFNCEYDYSQTGFEARIKTEKLCLLEKNYEIFIKLRGTKEVTEQSSEGNKVVEIEYDKTVSTKRYICRGEFTTVYPREKDVSHKITSGELSEVFSKGDLLLYREDADLYIYQYDKKLYWVAGEDFNFDDDGTTYLHYQLFTTNIDRLPIERLENEWHWDNRGFIFEKNESAREEGIPYRVVVRDIPSEYPVLNIVTGYDSAGSWIWQEYFNLNIAEFLR